jgi:hypothetical protein
VKLAIFMKLTGLEREPAEQRLKESGGFLREAIEQTRSQSAQDERLESRPNSSE